MKKESVRKANSLKGLLESSWAVGAQWPAVENQNDRKIDLRAPDARWKSFTSIVIAHMLKIPKTSLQTLPAHKIFTATYPRFCVRERLCWPAKRRKRHALLGSMLPAWATELTKKVCNIIIKNWKIQYEKLETWSFRIYSIMITIETICVEL